MITPAAFSGIAFPWILVDENLTLISEADGALFKKPHSDISSIIAISNTISIGGWTTCPKGYAIYRFSNTLIAPASIIIHGLKINGLSKAKGKTIDLSINLEQSHIQIYIQNFFTGLAALDGQYKSLIRQNIHEVRGINSALYNSAYELQEIIETPYPQRGIPISKSVVSLSELLRGRIDFMEFIANPDPRNVNKSEVFVYRKFDKVQRCFRVTAHKRGIDFQISGSSSKATYGPLAIFDLVPYLLLDNAVKYSPDNSPVSITCNDIMHFIFCTVTSKGPRIESSEIDDIFSPGFRGINALKSRKEGTGLGLSVLRKIVINVFGGSINITQGTSNTIINEVPYCDVKFEVKFPARQPSNF